MSKLYGVPVGFVTLPHPSFEAVYCFIYGRQKLVVARYWMICLVLVELFEIVMQSNALVAFLSHHFHLMNGLLVYKLAQILTFYSFLKKT